MQIFLQHQILNHENGNEKVLKEHAHEKEAEIGQKHAYESFETIHLKDFRVEIGGYDKRDKYKGENEHGRTNKKGERRKYSAQPIGGTEYEWIYGQILCIVIPNLWKQSQGRQRHEWQGDEHHKILIG